LLACALVLSVFALAGGLGLVVAGRDRPRLLLVINGFLLGAVPTLILVHVLPNLWDQLGAVALGLVAMGYGMLWLLERAAERQRLGARVVVTVLALHSMLDGASLAVAERLHLGRASAMLIAALVIHRLPEGLVVGTLLIPSRGVKVATTAAAVLAVMTLAGAAGGREVLQHANGSSLNFAVACGMGALLRAVLHSHASSRLQATPGVLGALFGVALALAVPELRSSHDNHRPRLGAVRPTDRLRVQ
jgi:zinc transporter ZupT